MGSGARLGRGRGGAPGRVSKKDELSQEQREILVWWAVSDMVSLVCRDLRFFRENSELRERERERCTV